MMYLVKYYHYYYYYYIDHNECDTMKDFRAMKIVSEESSTKDEKK